MTLRRAFFFLWFERRLRRATAAGSNAGAVSVHRSGASRGVEPDIHDIAFAQDQLCALLRFGSFVEDLRQRVGNVFALEQPLPQ